MDATQDRSERPFRILCLDGGGAKGFYTVGVLAEIEALLGGRRLYEQFDLIYGTSTGAIIAALLSLGRDVTSVHAIYRKHVVGVMGKSTAHAKSAALKELAEVVFDGATFDDVLVPIGLVATRWDFERPMIFKKLVTQAHGRHNSFVPGFGCTIAEAVQASCSAYPYFNRLMLKTARGELVDVFDGGFSANNPSLYAIADAVSAFGVAPRQIRLISVGVGMYPEPKRKIRERLKSWAGQALIDPSLVQRIMNVNGTSMEHLTKALFPDVTLVRINETFQKPEMATDFLESRLDKLNILYQRGRDSFAAYESALKSIFELS